MPKGRHRNAPVTRRIKSWLWHYCICGQRCIHSVKAQTEHSEIGDGGNRCVFAVLSKDTEPEATLSGERNERASPIRTSLTLFTLRLAEESALLLPETSHTANEYSHSGDKCTSLLKSSVQSSRTECTAARDSRDCVYDQEFKLILATQSAATHVTVGTAVLAVQCQYNTATAVLATHVTVGTAVIATHVTVSPPRLTPCLGDILLSAPPCTSLLAWILFRDCHESWLHD